MTPSRVLPLFVLVWSVGAAACSTDPSSAAPSPTPSPTPSPAAPSTPPTSSATAPPSTAPPSTAPPSTAPPSTAPPSTAPPSTAPPSTGDDQGFDADAAIAASREVFADLDPNGPGCSVAVMRDGEVWAEAYGLADVETGAPMTTSTIVDIGSTSKQFTATAIGLLELDGLVAPDAPVSSYLDGLPSWADEVTVDDLVHHTSGLEDYIGLLVEQGIDTDEPAGDAEALAALTASSLRFEPGDRFEYSNSNYFLLAEIVEAVTGDDLGAFLADRVFSPLGLDAVMDPTVELYGVAESYESVDGEWVDADSPWTQLGDGAVRTTPTELVRWAMEYAEPTVGGAALQALRFDGAADVADDFGIPGARYGYGIVEAEIDGVRVLTHGGAWGGFVTTFVVAPEFGVAVAGTCTSADVVPGSGDPGIELLALWV